MGADEQPKDRRERPTPLLRQDPRVPEARSSCCDAPAVVLVRKGANERIGVERAKIGVHRGVMCGSHMNLRTHFSTLKEAGSNRLS
ncbi:hypothetical protein DIPPA_26010 [Diplonema papillatum]|nr:hypothetical protein DIPPA_26010 [Diplonema papillatum]